LITVRVGAGPLFFVVVLSDRNRVTEEFFGRYGKAGSGKRGECMTKSENIERRTEELVTPILEELHMELFDVEYVKEAGSWYLRVYCDKEGGITVDDCEIVSRALEKKLDQEDFIPDAYILEVSSPGLGRPLKKEKDFARAVGKEVEIHTFRPVEHEKEFIGYLKAYSPDTVTIADDDGNELVLEKSNLALIRMAVRF